MTHDNSLSLAKIRPHLSVIANELLAELACFSQIDSTNSYLMTRAQTAAPSGCVCFAEQQTAGKGRRGRQWISPQGENIYGSILWRFDSAENLSGLSLVCGVGIIRALNRSGFSNVGLKWPNDIYSDTQKLGGILIEVMTHSNGNASAVIGFGLNVNMPSNVEGINQPYTDLRKVSSNIAVNRNQLAAQLLNELLPIIATFEKQGLAMYLNEWRDYDCLFGKQVTLFVGNNQMSGCVQGINENGLLCLQQGDGAMQFFASGEVSFSA